MSKYLTHTHALVIFWVMTALMITGWVWTVGFYESINESNIYFILILDMLIFPWLPLFILIPSGYFKEYAKKNA